MTNHPNRTTANRRRVIARHIAAAGYNKQDIAYGLSWAEAQGYSDAREGFVLAVSRILYSDDQLADGARFTVEDGFGPRRF